MSKRDPHPLIKQQAELDGYSERKHGEFDPDHFQAVQQLKFALREPDRRAKALQDVENAIAAPDGASLRSKSELLRLHRALKLTDVNMRKANR
jgi:hypothetical protein